MQAKSGNGAMQGPVPNATRSTVIEILDKRSVRIRDRDKNDLFLGALGDFLDDVSKGAAA